jgi:metallo-beta-lactamase family protein
MTEPRTIRFLGAAGTVTGSKHLVTLAGRQVLLDCGLFQGKKALRLRNWDAFPFDPREIDAVVLSHAHVDHSGALPLLARRGFRGPIYCTPPTRALARILLLDAARLQEEEADFANRHGYSKHRPALPLYRQADAEAALALLEERAFGAEFAVAPGVGGRYRRAGHILGAATVEVFAEGARPLRVAFSGDLGRWGRPILHDPERTPAADVVLVESTYGDRRHPDDAADRLARVVCETADRGGVILVPSFAVGRAQELLWTLRRLEEEGRIPPLPVFVDSPMAVDVTDLYCRFPEEHDIDMRLLADAQRCPLCCRQQQFVRSVADSKELNQRDGPMVVISASGMATGGRILHHLERRLPDERNTILLPGFQAEGTRGRALQEGAKLLKMHGAMVTVRAAVETLDGLSAHADRDDLLRGARGFERPPRRAWVVHGEKGAARALAEALRGEIGWNAAVAGDGETADLGL